MYKMKDEQLTVSHVLPAQQHASTQTYQHTTSITEYVYKYIHMSTTTRAYMPCISTQTYHDTAHIRSSKKHTSTQRSRYASIYAFKHNNNSISTSTSTNKRNVCQTTNSIKIYQYKRITTQKHKSTQVYHNSSIYAHKLITSQGYRQNKRVRTSTQTYLHLRLYTLSHKGVIK